MSASRAVGVSRPRAAALFASVLVVSAPCAVLAGEAKPRADYIVPPGCATREVWLEGLRARLPPLLRSSPLLQTLSVGVESVPSARGRDYAGTLGSAGEVPLESTRQVRGPSCEDVLDALTFIAALALERAANAEPTSATEALPSEAPGVTAPAAQAQDAPPPGAGSTALGRVQLGATVFALLQSGFTPGPALQLGAALRAGWSLPGWQPLMLLGVHAGSRDERLEGGARVHFSEWSLEGVGCPWRFPSSGPLGVRPCLDADAGRSAGTGSGVEGAVTRASPSFSVGAGLRLDLTLWDRLELAASLGAVKPLWHAHFYFLPGATAFETPELGIRAGSSASLLF